MDASIIVCTYNRAESLRDTLHALRTQQTAAVRQWEVIVVDNNSKDHTRVVVEEMHRAFFDTMFAVPAKCGGAARWGIKGVRLGSEHALYLRWLYPKAKFIFLYRNPLDAYRSYARYGRSWYDIFPNKPMFTPSAFGTHWRQLMQGYLKDTKKLDALLVRYEDLIGERPPLEEIDAYLGIRMNHSVLGAKVGSSERGGEKARGSRLEKWLLKRAVAPMAQELGYDW